MIDARSQTGTAPDEQTAMRYPTRASELDHRRLQVPPSPLHDPSPNQLHAGGVESVPVVFAVLDKGHQRVTGLYRVGWKLSPMGQEETWRPCGSSLRGG